MPILFLEKQELKSVVGALKYFNDKKHIESKGTFHRSTRDIEISLRNKLEAM